MSIIISQTGYLIVFFGIDLTVANIFISIINNITLSVFICKTCNQFNYGASTIFLFFLNPQSYLLVISYRLSANGYLISWRITRTFETRKSVIFYMLIVQQIIC